MDCYRDTVNFRPQWMLPIQERQCYKCGLFHPKFMCTANMKSCFKCGKMGHFARVCFTKFKEVSPSSNHTNGKEKATVKSKRKQQRDQERYRNFKHAKQIIREFPFASVSNATLCTLLDNPKENALREQLNIMKIKLTKEKENNKRNTDLQYRRMDILRDMIGKQEVKIAALQIHQDTKSTNGQVQDLTEKIQEHTKERALLENTVQELEKEIHRLGLDKKDLFRLNDMLFEGYKKSIELFDLITTGLSPKFSVNRRILKKAREINNRQDLEEEPGDNQLFLEFLNTYSD